MKKQLYSVIIIFLILFCCNFSYTLANPCIDKFKSSDDINSKCNVQLAQVKRVVDGDTIHIYTGYQVIKVRLYGIDCMETSKIYRAYRQAYENKTSIEDIIKQGNFATSELEKIIKENNNHVYFKTMGIDVSGRLLAILYDKNMTNINDKMLNTGYCPVYVFNKNK